MPQLILSSDTLYVGMNAINDWFSGSSIILSSTTNSSVLNINSTTTIASGVVWGFAPTGRGSILSSGAYSTVINGSGHSASNNFSLIGNGRGNTVSGLYSSVLNGRTNTASALNSTVINGQTNLASGTKSLIGNGSNNISSGYYSVVLNGNGNRTTTSYSVILNGENHLNSGYYSLIGNGKSNRIDGTSNTYYTTILNGLNNRIYNSVNSVFSTILGGISNKITGRNGLAFGNSNVISHDYCIVVGNNSTTNAAKQMIFSNGASNITVRIDYLNGRIYTDGGATFTPADYAEYFEWEDENPNTEKRYGYAVSLVQDGKIRIGNENIIGIVSSAPGIIGDAAELGWKNKYQIDEWGQIKTENLYRYDITRDVDDKNQMKTIWVDSLGDQYSSEPKHSHEKKEYFITDKVNFTEEEERNKKSVSVNLFSEEFDFTKEYTPRSERKEFAPIGLLGKLRVRTAEKINSKLIDFNFNGEAVNGTKYTVIEKIKEFDGNFGIVKIFFK